MQRSLRIRVALGLCVLAVLASACSSGVSEIATDDTTAEHASTGGSLSSATPVADDSAPFEITTTIPEVPNSTEVRTHSEGAFIMGQANWDSGWVHAHILHDLVEELGYEVTTPGDREFAPDRAYEAMANGQIDFWANSWYPGHMLWWDGELRTGEQVGSKLTRMDQAIAPASGLQGWLVTKAWAEQNGVTTIDQINADPTLWQQLDTDGNGKGEFFGCPEDWSCDDIMSAMSTFADWRNLEQMQTDYDIMFDEFLSRAEQGEPAIAYTWAPSVYLARANVGETTMWISILDASVVDDSNPLQIDVGPPGWDCQRCDGAVGFKELSADICLQGPDGCQLGWSAASIEITANQTWLNEHPDVHELFQQVRFSAGELSTLLLDVEQAAGDQIAVEAVAQQWIAENRDKVDRWLDAASGH